MKKIVFSIIIVLGTFNSVAQIENIKEKFNLPTILSESSGTIFFNGKLITHNDSGNENVLYEMDTISGTITRSVIIENATNVDWEDITQDDSSIYIGDIGNNNGTRTNLKIYKINKNDYLNLTKVTSEIINFNYSDQIDFTPNPNNTEWDSEALINLDTSLILFTKNWVNGISKAYLIPKNSGTYSINPLPTHLISEGLITGATYNKNTGILYLAGYNTILQPFIWIIKEFSNYDIFSGINTKVSLPSLGFEQIEAITQVGPNRYFMTSESFNFPPFSENAKLISFTTNDPILSLEQQSKQPVSLYPNPVKDILIIEGVDFDSVEILDINTRLIKQINSKEINISELKSGIYLIKINFANNTSQTKKIFKI